MQHRNNLSKMKKDLYESNRSKNQRRLYVHLGRPTKVTDDMQKQVITLIDDEVGIKKIAKSLNVGIGTVYSIMKQNNIKSKKCNNVQKSVVTELP